MYIEDQIKYFQEELRRIHNKLDMHQWIKVYRPWNCSERVRQQKRHTEATCNCSGVFAIECQCGELRESNRNHNQYVTAKQPETGY